MGRRPGTFLIETYLLKKVTGEAGSTFAKQTPAEFRRLPFFDEQKADPAQSKTSNGGIFSVRT